MILVLGVWGFVRALLLNSAAVALENVVLRHQLAILERSVARPRLRWRNRIFWVGALTALAWHRQGFQLYWRWKSRARSAGRPPIDVEIRMLIHRMADENPTLYSVRPES